MKTTRALTRKSGVAILLVVIVVLALGKDFFQPLVLAALLSLCLAPVVRWLVGKGIPNFLAILTSVISMMLVLGAITWCIAGQVQGILADLPRYQENLHRRIDSFRHLPEGTIARAGAAIADIQKDIDGSASVAPPKPGAAQPQSAEHERAKSEASGGGDTAKHPAAAPEQPRESFKWRDILGIAENALTPFATASAVLLFSIFMLLQRDDIHDRFIMLSGSMAGKHNMRRSAEALEETFARISKYLLMQILTNGLTGAVMGVALWALGVPNALLWGILAMMLRFIPYIGMIIAALATVLFTIAISADWTMPLIVLGTFAAVELTVSNVIEPMLYGHGTGLSSLAILISAAFWACIWGLPGLFLSIPLTVCLVVIGRHVPFLDFLETLLCDRASLPKDSLLYHRLLIMQDGVMQTEIDKLCQGLSADRSFDLVYLPTLRIAEQELLFERLPPERFSGLLQNMRIAVEDLSISADDVASSGEADAASVPDGSPPKPLKVLCIAAHGELDAMMTAMIMRALRAPTLLMVDFSSGITAEAIAMIAHEDISAVIVASASETSTMTAITWCRVLRSSYPRLPILGCAWDEDDKLENRMELVRRRRGVRMCSSLSALKTLLAEVVAPVHPEAPAVASAAP